MPSRYLIHRITIACVALAGLPAFAQADIKTVVLKHLKTSRDFTLKVAEQMPEADYGFKLTPPQMSFGEQIVHLTQEQAGFIAPISGEKAAQTEPASMKKKDIIDYVRRTYDANIDKISKLTP